MLGLNETGGHAREVRFRKTSFLFMLAATALFLVSFALQLAASLQRWVTFSGPQGPTDRSIEDHAYDYFLPFEGWEPIGNAAQLLGAGLLIQVLGLFAMALAVMLLPAASTVFGRAATVASAVVEVVLVLLVAAAFTLHGGLVLVAGVNGTATGLEIGPGVFWSMLLVALVGLVALALFWGYRLPAAGIACVFLIGSTMAGYLLATSMVAPLFLGMSHDTARFTETVVAASTAAAAVSVAVGARNLVRRKAIGIEPA